MFQEKNPVFQEKNPVFQEKNPVFQEKNPFFLVFMLGKPRFSAVKLGFLAKTLLFCYTYSMKTLLFNRKPGFSTENLGFQQKPQVFSQKNPACRLLPILLAINDTLQINLPPIEFMLGTLLQ